MRSLRAHVAILGNRVELLRLFGFHKVFAFVLVSEKRVPIGKP